MPEDKKVADKDDDEIVVIETPETDEAKTPDKADAKAPDKAEAKAPDKADDKSDDDDDYEEDARLADSQDDTDAEVISANRKRRLKRREMRKRARENTERELRALREQNNVLLARLTGVEKTQMSQTVAGVDQHLNAAVTRMQQAEAILAKAVTAGNGDDVAQALRIRDEARDQAQRLSSYKEQLAQDRPEQPQQSQPKTVGADPQVQHYAREWLAANDWLDDEEDRRIVKVIDDGVANDGFDPRTLEYWKELTRRVAARFGDDDAGGGAQPKRKGPPTGAAREHASQSGRKEVHVTPERKRAMIEAGAWDDPERRRRYLKAYHEYDKSHAAR